MSDRTVISSSIDATRAEVLSDETSCYSRQPTRDELQESVYKMRAEIDRGNRELAEWRRGIEDCIEILRGEA